MGLQNELFLGGKLMMMMVVVVVVVEKDKRAGEEGKCTNRSCHVGIHEVS